MDRYETMSLRAHVGMFRSESMVTMVLWDILLKALLKSTVVAMTAPGVLGVLSRFLRTIEQPGSPPS